MVNDNGPWNSDLVPEAEMMCNSIQPFIEASLVEWPYNLPAFLHFTWTDMNSKTDILSQMVWNFNSKQIDAFCYEKTQVVESFIEEMESTLFASDVHRESDEQLKIIVQEGLTWIRKSPIFQSLITE